MMLPTHFSLEELVAWEVATRRGRDNTPPNEVMRNLSRSKAWSSCAPRWGTIPST